jgi:hypothetical protein
MAFHAVGVIAVAHAEVSDAPRPFHPRGRHDAQAVGTFLSFGQAGAREYLSARIELVRRGLLVDRIGGLALLVTEEGAQHFE